MSTRIVLSHPLDLLISRCSDDGKAGLVDRAIRGEEPQPVDGEVGSCRNASLSHEPSLCCPRISSRRASRQGKGSRYASRPIVNPNPEGRNANPRRGLVRGKAKTPTVTPPPACRWQPLRMTWATIKTRGQPQSG